MRKERERDLFQFLVHKGEHCSIHNQLHQLDRICTARGPPFTYLARYRIQHLRGCPTKRGIVPRSAAVAGGSSFQQCARGHETREDSWKFSAASYQKPLLYVIRRVSVPQCEMIKLPCKAKSPGCGAPRGDFYILTAAIRLPRRVKDYCQSLVTYGANHFFIIPLLLLEKGNQYKVTPKLVGT